MTSPAASAAMTAQRVYAGRRGGNHAAGGSIATAFDVVGSTPH
jgi:hypothetical protein